MPEPGNVRRRRANGEESRRRILDAAVEVAGERGYEGTSIALVSERCGLPASSIYWHFANKDALIAAVIEESFGVWLQSMAIPADAADSPLEWLTALGVGTARALRQSPEFLRLGLMLVLERRPEEPTARVTFLQLREAAHQRIAAVIAELASEADDDTVELLTTYAIAAADGFFLARETRGDRVDLERLFALHARILIEVIAPHLPSRPTDSPTGSPPATPGRPASHPIPIGGTQWPPDPTVQADRWRKPN